MPLIHRRHHGTCPICGGDSCIGFPDQPTRNSPFIKGTFEKMAQEPTPERCVEEDTSTDPDTEKRRAHHGPRHDRMRRPSEDRERCEDEDR